MRYLILLTLLLSAGALAELYKWVDADGNTHYTDTPPPQTATSQNIQQLPNLNGYTPAPVADRPANVTMYSTTWCGFCKKARRYFEANNIAFRELDIEASRSAHRRFKELGGKGVPLIVVGDKQMSGFSAARFESLFGG